MSRYYFHWAVYDGDRVVKRDFYEHPARKYAAKHGLDLKEEFHISTKRRTVSCVKCGSRSIRTNEYIDYGDGTGRHIVCPNRGGL